MNIKTYLINLDSSHERLDQATAQLKAIEWSFERFAAHDGRGKGINSFEHYDDALTQKILGRSLLNAELGCYLSHYECVERFLMTDAEFLVVLEDDMKITGHFKQEMGEVLSYLEGVQDLDWYVVNLAAKKKKFAKNIIQFEHVSLFHAYYFPIRSLGLIWSRKGAEAFIKQCKNITLPVDVFFQTWLSKNGKGLAVWPPLVEPAGFDSDILGTLATEEVSRKEKENRGRFYCWKKQRRMWRDRCYALMHLLKN